MKKELFGPFKVFILESIEDVYSQDRLLICFALIDMFINRFLHLVDRAKYDEAVAELWDAYNEKEQQLKHQ